VDEFQEAFDVRGRFRSPELVVVLELGRRFGAGGQRRVVVEGLGDPVGRTAPVVDPHLDGEPPVSSAENIAGALLEPFEQFRPVAGHPRPVVVAPPVEEPFVERLGGCLGKDDERFRRIHRWIDRE